MEEKKIFVIGDSISIQCGPFLEEYLKGFNICYSRKEDNEDAFAATTNLDQPMGANGGDSSVVLQYLHHKTSDLNGRCDYLLINCGLHDIKTDPQSKKIQIPIEEYKQNLTEIVQLVHTS